MSIETTAALRVDLLDPGAPQIIHAVQDDSNSRKIKLLASTRVERSGRCPTVRL